MNRQDLKNIAPKGLEDLTERVRVHLCKEAKAICEQCGADSDWVFSDLQRTRVVEIPARTVLGPFVFICNRCRVQTRLIKPSNVGLRSDIEVQ